jgi:hypothetical protein
MYFPAGEIVLIIKSKFNYLPTKKAFAGLSK